MSEEAPGLVSVVMPCYNVEAWVGEALSSLLSQSWPSLEILALDDGSSDGTRAYLESRAAADDRIRVVVSEENRGLIHTLNRGLDLVRGEFVARMDADDTCHHERIRLQVEYLTSRPDVDVVSVGSYRMDEQGRPRSRVPVRCSTAPGARFLGLFGTPLVHGATLARASVMRRYRYRTDGRALHTEDYELFSRMLIDGVAMENLDMPLYGIRVRPGSVSRRFEKVQIANFVQCAARYLEETTGEWRGAGPHRVLVNRMDASTRASHLRSGLVWLRELESGFCAAEDGCEEEIRRIADQQRVDILIQALRRGRASVRLAAAGLMARYVRSFASGAGRRYLASKLRAATLTRGELEG